MVEIHSPLNHKDPETVACPFRPCQAPIGRPCRDGAGRDLDRSIYHRSRALLADGA